MFVESYGELVAGEAVARTARHLSEISTCSITVLHGPAFQKFSSTLIGVDDCIVSLRSNVRLSAGMSVQISVGHSMVIFGTVCAEPEFEDDAGPRLDVAVTMALIRSTERAVGVAG